MISYYLLLLPIIPAVLGCIASYFAYKAKKGVQEIHVMINSRMTAWLKAAESAAHAAGVLSMSTCPILHQPNGAVCSGADNVSLLAQEVAKELLKTAQVAAAKLLAEAVVERISS